MFEALEDVDDRFRLVLREAAAADAVFEFGGTAFEDGAVVGAAVHVVHRDFGGGAVLRGRVGAEDGPDERIEDARYIATASGAVRPVDEDFGSLGQAVHAREQVAHLLSLLRGRMQPLRERRAVDRGGVSLLLLGQRGHDAPRPGEQQPAEQRRLYSVHGSRYRRERER